MTSKRPQIIALAALVALALIWSFNWVLMKIAVNYASPFDFAALRTFYGALSLFLVLLWRQRSDGAQLWPAHWPSTLAYGLLHSGGTIGFSTWALVSGGAGKTALLTYTMSFWTLLFAWMALGEVLRRSQVWGVGLAGMGLLSLLLPLSFSHALSSKGLAILAGVCWAAAAVLAKRHPPQRLLNFATWQLLLGSLPLLAISMLLPSSPIQWTPVFIGALLYNILPGTAIAWLLWLYALKRLPTAIVSLGSLLTPVLSIGMAALWLGEVPTLTEAAGIGLILVAFGVNVSFAWHRPSRKKVDPPSRHSSR